MSSSAQTFYQFGPFHVEVERYLLLRGEESIPISPKVFETLLYLVQHSSQVCRKDEIINAVWPDTIVEENNLAQNVFLLRKALGEDKTDHRYIVTIPGVGYRFVAPLGEPSPTQAIAELMAGRSVGSIAVLPFRNIVEEEGEAFLGPGLADALITRLSSIRSLKVRPTTAVLKYGASQHDPLLIGQELNVDALLTGIYQHEGDKIRVSVQLVGVTDGVTLWAAKFDEQFTNIFAIQDSISAQVVNSLALELSREEQRQLRSSYTDCPEAFQLYIKGRYFWNLRTPEGLRKALEYSQQAVAIDPTYAPAYVGLADSYNLLGAQHAVLAPMESFPKARAAALRALEIDAKFAEAYASLGFINCYYGWDWTSAEHNYQKAIELKPNYPTAHHWYGELLTTLSRFSEAARELQMAQQLDPLSLAINADLAASFFYSRQYDRSARQLHNLLELNPNFMRAHLLLGLVYQQEGKPEKALDTLRRAVELSSDDPVNLSALGYVLGIAGNTYEARKMIGVLRKLAIQRYVPACSLAAVFIGLGDTDSAFASLEKALEDRDIELSWLKVNPIYDSLRTDSRFLKLMSQVAASLL